jgi:hypothetical protein
MVRWRGVDQVQGCESAVGDWHAFRRTS